MSTSQSSSRRVVPRARLSKGTAWLQSPLLNKGTAFTEAEREILGLRGLLPPRVATLEEQVLRVMSNYRKKPNDIEKYIYLIGLQDRCETLFYRVIIDHLEEMMPIIYTPTVGKACQEYGSLFRRPRGFYVSAYDRGRVAQILQNWPRKDVRVIVVTDGERILGLGDLGTYGMGIPIGKLSLYTACAGIHPGVCLPVTIDVGTENEALLHDPLYTGLRQHRLRGQAYDELIDEFVSAVQTLFPKALIQFEDFANSNAFRLLRTYQSRVCTFNDDIQGTGAVVLAGIYSALRVTGGRLQDQIILCLGAGEAGIGIGDSIVAALRQAGLGEDRACQCTWFVDSQGLIVKSRTSLADRKLPYAHDHACCPNLLSAIESLKPTILIGASGVPGSFSEPIIRAMARLNKRPVIFALSNPTSKSECTAEEAYRWSEGRAMFASGSPFSPVNLDGHIFVPGQGNNAYIFPGVGLGVVASQAKHVTNSMFLQAAQTLAAMVSPADLEQGRLYPPLHNIREVSVAIATAVAEEAYRQRLARVRKPKDLGALIRAKMYEPQYTAYV
ncbi:MAG: NAD-dependent malic enzyme [Bacillota bacterium]